MYKRERFISLLFLHIQAMTNDSEVETGQFAQLHRLI